MARDITAALPDAPCGLPCNFAMTALASSYASCASHIALMAASTAARLNPCAAAFATMSSITPVVVTAPLLASLPAPAGFFLPERRFFLTAAAAASPEAAAFVDLGAVSRSSSLSSRTFQLQAGKNHAITKQQ